MLEHDKRLQHRPAEHRLRVIEKLKEFGSNALAEAMEKNDS